jgi:ADP-ribose pyrophosphatase YjhB (NUDIX family)
MAKRLHAIASTGSHFTEGVFDRERYTEIGQIASQMLSLLGNVPVDEVNNLFPDFGTGYATPRIDVRGAIIEGDQVLLVQEKSDQKWTFPGGYAETGLTLSANVLKEIHEEAGVSCEVVRLMGVRHKAAHAYKPDIREFYKIFVLCRMVPGQQPVPGVETADARFFPINALPPLSTGRIIRKDIEAAYFYQANPDAPAFFD